MTYNQKVRNAIFSSFEESNKNDKAFLKGVFKAAGEVKINSKGRFLSLRSFNFDFISFIARLLKNLYGTEIEIEIKNSKYPNKSKLFILETNAKISEILMNDLDFKHNDIYTLENEIPSDIFNDREVFKNYLKGVFASSGSMYLPTGAKGDDVGSKGGYHLEISLKNEEYANNLLKVLKRYNLNLKITERSEEHYMLYAKDGETIKDFLAFMDLSDMVLELCDLMLTREISKEANRLTNCNIANITKTVEAAERQLEAINKLKERGMLDKLSEKLKVTAELRLKYPEATLDEIAIMHADGVKKSGINHRFRKIIEIAALYEGEENG